jgi:DNA-binding MarR family transcriptional regulator
VGPARPSPRERLRLTDGRKVTIVIITLVIDMPNPSFLKQYLYGPAASREPAPAAPQQAIPGRRAPAYLANRFVQITRAAMAQALEPHGLTGQQWGVMVAIQREPGTDQRRVALRQGLDNNSASRLVDELEELGLVRRVPSPSDRRANLLELTRAGSSKRARLQDAVLAAQDSVLACLAPAKRATFLDLLTRVVEANEHLARPGVGRRKPVRRTAHAPAATA